MSRLQLQSLSKSYGSRELFTDVSLELAPGDRLALIGSNGCGKSTLLNIIARYALPDSGKVLTFPKESGLGYGAQELNPAHIETPLLDFVLEVLPSWSRHWKRRSQAVEADDHLELQALARVLVQGSDILLLDEPTNHLDLEAVRRLESFLSTFQGVLVFVAHDRFFLDQVANRVLFMDTPRPIFFEGNFTRFLSRQQEREAALSRQRSKLQQEIEHKQSFVDRFRYKARKASQAQSRVKQIKRLEQEHATLAPTQAKKKLDFSWPTPPRSNAVLVSATDLEAPYPEGNPLFTGLNFQLFRGQKVALAGANGCGKTTLLKCITKTLRPGAGAVTLGSMVHTASFSQQATDILDSEKTVLAQIRSLTGPGIKDQELFSVLGLFLLGQDFWDQRVARLSGGEKSRLILAGLFVSQANLLILDEPTNHLDIESREALIQALKLYSGTLLFVAHDRALLSEVTREIRYLGPQGLEFLHGGYREYEQKMTAAAGLGPPISRKASDQVLRTREQKRQEARTRNERFRLLKPLKKEYSELESQFDGVLQKMEEVEQSLAATETYTNGELVQKLNRQYHDHQLHSESLLTEMERLEEEMQLIEKDRKNL